MNFKKSDLINKSFSFFQEFTRSDDEKRLVKGIASKEEVDSYGDIVLFDAMKEAFGDYLGKQKENGSFTYGNIREMHGSSAAGKVVSYEMKEDKKETWIEVKVVDDQAWEKVKNDVYSGFSIGGKIEDAEAIIEEFENENGETIDRVIGYKITKIKLIEISLVDRPACPSALIDSYKSASKDESFVPDIVLGVGSDQSSPVAQKNNSDFKDHKQILKFLTNNSHNMKFKTIWENIAKSFANDNISLEDISKNDSTVELEASQIHNLLKSISKATFDEIVKSQEEDVEDEEIEKNEEEEIDETDTEEKEGDVDNSDEDDTEEKEENDNDDESEDEDEDVSKALMEEVRKLSKSNSDLAKQVETLAKASSMQKGETEEKEEDVFKGTIL